MQKDKPLVSVVIPTYKRPNKLSRAIDSVLNQTYPNVEIIVIDDNDPDTEGRMQTEHIMEAYISNSRVIYIRHDRNKNGAAARNTGAKFSKAKYIALLDDDDEFLPRKIESQVEKLENLSSEWGACYSMAYMKKPNKAYIELQENREGYLYLKALTRELTILAGSNLLVRKCVWDEVGGFNETFKRNQDIEFTTRILKKYKLAYSPEPGLIVYIHSDQLNVKVLDVDNQYYNLFRDQIESLNPIDRKEFERVFKRDKFFHALSNDHNYKYCIRALIKHNVQWRDTFSYHLKRAWNRLLPARTVERV